MIELSSSTDAVAGGNVFLDLAAAVKLGLDGISGYMAAMSYVGGTLNNYYGQETTLDIVAAGNMGA